MSNESEIKQIMESRLRAIDEASEKKQKYFDIAANKLKPFIDVLQKYNMQFLQVPFRQTEYDFGIFSKLYDSCVVISLKGVGLLDATKSDTDKARFVEISLASYELLPEESMKGDMINIVGYIIRNLDSLLNEEENTIKNFYEAQLAQAKANAEGWDDLIEGIA